MTSPLGTPSGQQQNGPQAQSVTQPSTPQPAQPSLPSQQTQQLKQHPQNPQESPALQADQQQSGTTPGQPYNMLPQDQSGRALPNTQGEEILYCIVLFDSQFVVYFILF